MEIKNSHILIGICAVGAAYLYISNRKKNDNGRSVLYSKIKELFKNGYIKSHTTNLPAQKGVPVLPDMVKIKQDADKEVQGIFGSFSKGFDTMNMNELNLFYSVLEKRDRGVSIDKATSDKYNTLMSTHGLGGV